jgi:hypothetical protein
MNAFRMLKNDVYPGLPRIYPHITTRAVGYLLGLTAKKPSLMVAATKLPLRFAFPQ